MSGYNIFSIDAEEWFQVCYGSDDNPMENWAKHESLIEPMIRDTLRLLSNTNTKATFFVVGWWAERYPDVVKLIAQAGHEVASHGYSHTPAFEQSLDEFKRDIVRAKKVIEGAINNEVVGYRAPAFSISRQDRDKLAAVASAGYLYDSSVLSSKNTIYEVCDGLIEITPNSIDIGEQSLPSGGGFFFRILPYFIFKRYLNWVLFKKQSLVFYTHTWEINSEYPRLNMSYREAFIQYSNLSGVPGKLIKLLNEYKFHTAKEVCHAHLADRCL